ncbi:MAG: LysR family transcriptional regulator [Aerococcus sp.]|nr:LysR family transcriptional regulator [Aerococcus sp.]
MELRHLLYFSTVAEEGNITRAANRLHITQPTLSRQIHALEEDLGTDLFLRDKNHLTLTEAGLFLKNRAEELLTLADQTERDFREQQRKLLSGHISIGAVEADNSETLAMVLEEFTTDYPQVTFNLFSGASDIIKDRLEKGLLDVALLLEPVDDVRYQKIVLPWQERWGLLVPTSSFLAQQPASQPEDLRGVPLMVAQRTEVQRFISQWAGYPFDELNIVGNFNLSFNVFPLVSAGIGSAIGIEGVIRDRNTEAITFIPFEPALKSHCLLVWKKNRTLSPTVAAFIKRFDCANKA